MRTPTRIGKGNDKIKNLYYSAITKMGNTVIVVSGANQKEKKFAFYINK